MRTCILDGDEIMDREMLHAVLAERLELPDWYGKNLDALGDCLTDVREETEIVLEHPDALRAHLGRYADFLVQALKEISAENPHIRITERS